MEHLGKALHLAFYIVILSIPLNPFAPNKARRPILPNLIFKLPPYRCKLQMLMIVVPLLLLSSQEHTR